MTPEELGEVLKKNRDEKGITRYKVHFVDKVMTQPTLLNIEEGRGGTIATLLKYCEYLDIEIILKKKD